MSHYDRYETERSDRLYDDRDPYGGRSAKRQRSPSPAYNRHGSGGGAYGREEWGDAKRARPRDAHERDDRSRSPDRRAWHDLEPEEKERQWQRYERERERDREANWDRYRGGRSTAQEVDSLPPRPVVVGGGDNSTGQGLHDPMDSPTLLTFKRYVQVLRDAGTEPLAAQTSPEATQALFDRYQVYRKDFQRRAMDQFFKLHRGEAWFKERFGVGAEEIEARRLRRKAGREGKKRVWLQELRTGALDQINLGVHNERGGSTLQALTRLGEVETLDDAESFSLPAQPNEMLIRQVPTEVTRADVEAVLEQQPGFRYLAMGEPHPLKRYSRVGCAIFDPLPVDEMQTMAQQLSQKPIAGQLLAFELANRPAQSKLRIAPGFADTLSRLVHDLRQARTLVALLEREDREELWKEEEDVGEAQALDVDASAEIEAKAVSIVARDEQEEESLRAWLVKHVHVEEGTEEDRMDLDRIEEETARDVVQKHDLARKLLDLHIDLLRQAYNCDYYTATLTDFPEELVRRAPRALRFAADAIPSSESHDKAKLWAANVDSKFQLLLRPDDDRIATLGGKGLRDTLLELAAPYSREDEAEKHRCIVRPDGQADECGKLFKAQIFVQKHVLNKHRQWLYDTTAEQIDEVRYFNNYVRDPQRPMPTAHPDKAGTANNGSLTNRLSSTAGRPGGGNGAHASAHYYGSGNLVRLGNGGMTATVAGAGLRDELANGGMMRLGATLAAPLADSLPYGGAAQPMAGAQPMASMALPRAPLPTMMPQALDPRAARAPQSYQDLDAGVPSGTAEIELEY